MTANGPGRNPSSDGSAEVAQTFADALRTAVGATDLSLQRMRHRLDLLGISISVATLSYWQSGQRLPSRRHTRAVLPALESVLALPPGTLSSLVRHPGPRTRSDAPSILAEGGLWPDPARVSSLLGQVDTRWDHRLTRISQHDRVLVNADRTEHSLWSMQVLRAIVDGPDRWVAVVHRVDEPACPPPVVTGLRNCHLGRLVHDRESGLLATELLFDRPLMRGETLITEHLLTFGRPAPLAFHYERKLPYRVRMYTQEVCFASSARPRRIRSLSRPADGISWNLVRDLHLNASSRAHLVLLDADPGVYGTEWDWG
ncbi:hypothetical protein Lfu02_68230 [Longispora fulva]|uniref:Uncharacterized protein n=1 Tax=Longispora fulva TaxID=619741 RepID=A0A8J7KII9_9ACTN|nr:hypothetical protein [Longispora fulva]MBG6134076.1 hypothetical protein [Longispora fulva]GIG62451.1 hypothetical protein Lfu02_68230 [Longispora fulva]